MVPCKQPSVSLFLKCLPGQTPHTILAVVGDIRDKTAFGSPCVDNVCVRRCGGRLDCLPSHSILSAGSGLSSFICCVPRAGPPCELSVAELLHIKKVKQSHLKTVCFCSARAWSLGLSPVRPAGSHLWAFLLSSGQTEWCFKFLLQSFNFHQECCVPSCGGTHLSSLLHRGGGAGGWWAGG